MMIPYIARSRYEDHIYICIFSTCRARLIASSSDRCLSSARALAVALRPSSAASRVIYLHESMYMNLDMRIIYIYASLVPAARD